MSHDREKMKNIFRMIELLLILIYESTSNRYINSITLSNKNKSNLKTDNKKYYFKIKKSN